jgi:prolyl oligopeptidase
MGAPADAVFLLALLAALGVSSARSAPEPEDPYLWLEDVAGERALDWVRARNAEALRALGGDALRATESRLLDILDSDARIPFVEKRGPWYYNFWKDAKHPRGLWRRTRLESFRTPEPAWESVLDLDALAAQESEGWVWQGANCLPPAYARCLVSLSRGGADAGVVREFDLVSKAFVEGGFFLPEAKTSASWKDADHLYVGTDFGPGSLTRSGYPRVAKLWRRGTPLAQAQTLFEGLPDDVWVYAFRDHTKGFERDFVARGLTFFTSELFLLRADELVRIDKPASANASVHRDLLLIELREDWSAGGGTWPAGALLATDLEGHLRGERRFEVLFEPGERRSLAGYSPTRNHILVNELDNVRNRVYVASRHEGGWTRQPLPGLPEFGSVGASAVDDEDSDDYWLTVTDYLTPTRLLLGSVGRGAAEALKANPAFFDASGLAVSQREAVSRDGTRIPYFEVARRDLVCDGRSPTLLYGYGGFEVSELPVYSPAVGAGWLEKGGVYVVANIRGGGEFGPAWHRAALKAQRPRAYEDFIAVAEDLVARRVTSPARLGILGGSNGGLLVGNMLTLRPELFGAVVCKAPLLDMRRYHRLLAGASWLEEYGDPDDPQQWEFIRRFSPYHNLERGVSYPPVLITTSTRDDRVHPAHARKMTARLLELGLPVLYYENIEGGHGGAADNRQLAHMSALAFEFLRLKLR